MRVSRWAVLLAVLAFAIGCAERMVTVRQGTRTVCEDCGKVLAINVHPVQVRVSQAPSHKVVTRKQVCPACQAKRERRAKIDAFAEFLGPLNFTRERDRQGVEKEYVVYVDGIYDERKKVPMEVVESLSDATDFDREKYTARGPLKLTDIYAPPGSPPVWVTWVQVTENFGGNDYADAYIANTTDKPVHRAVIEIEHYDDDVLKHTDTVDFLEGKTLAPHAFDRFRAHIGDSPGMQYQYRLKEE